MAELYSLYSFSLLVIDYSLYFIHILRRLHSYAAYDDTDYSIRVTALNSHPLQRQRGKLTGHILGSLQIFQASKFNYTLRGPARALHEDRVYNGHSPIATATPAPFSIRTSLNLQMALTGSTNSVTHVREMVNALVNAPHLPDTPSAPLSRPLQSDQQQLHH